MNDSTLIPTLRNLIENGLAERLDEHLEGFAKALSETDSGKVSATVSIKAVLVSPKLVIDLGFAYGQRYGSKSQFVGDIDDPKQPKIPGIERTEADPNEDDHIRDIMKKERVSYRHAAVIAKNETEGK